MKNSRNYKYLYTQYKKTIKRNIFYLVVLSVYSSNALTKVTPPNYDFSLDKVQVFLPGTKLSEIQKKYPENELMIKEDGFITYRYYIEHIRYKFPLLVQTYNGIVTDVFMKLPSYFLHNVFHQSLINRIGPQDKYKKIEEQAIYIWSNKKNLKHTYFASCTITCFPVYYSVEQVQQNYSKQYTTLLTKFNASESGLLKSLSQ